MPIQVKAPDGSIAQFPDGMPDAQIEAVMQREYPQPTTMQKIVASPLGRFVHDAVVLPVEGGANMLAKGASGLVGDLPSQLIESGISKYQEPAYEAALAANRNTPGYAAARARANAVQSHKVSGATDQFIAPLVPALAGAMGGLLGGSMDQANASADAATAAMDQYRSDHPVAAMSANLAGGLLLGPKAPELPATLPKAQPLSPLGDVAPKASQQALTYVSKLAKSSGKTPVDLSAAFSAAGGKPLTAAEAIGKPGTIGLAALARRPGATADALQGLLDERSAGAAGRVLDDFQGATGIDPAAARGDLESLVAAGRAKAQPAYELAYAHPPVTTDRLTQFSQEPIVQQGMKTGIKIERLKSLAEGRPFDPNAYAITGFDEAGDPIIGAVPTWRTWDAAKLGLDNMLDAYRDKTTGKVVLDKMGDAINSVRKSMLSELDAVNPAYKVARATAGDYLSASDAFRRGQKAILNGNLPAQDFNAMLAKMGPADRDAFKGGIANQLFSLAQNDRLALKAFNRPIVQQKLEVALGKDQAQQFLARIKTEAQMARDAGRMRPGNYSPTAELTDAMRDQDGGGSLVSFGADALGNMVSHGSVKGGLARTAIDYARKPLDAFRTRGMSMGIPARDEAGRLLMLTPGDLTTRLSQPGITSQPILQAPSLTPRAVLPYGLFGSGTAAQRQ